jgi:hypothetical protein
VISGNGATRSVAITPSPGQLGTSVVTVGVSDGTNTATITFEITVQNGVSGRWLVLAPVSGYTWSVETLPITPTSTGGAIVGPFPATAPVVLSLVPPVKAN